MKRDLWKLMFVGITVAAMATPAFAGEAGRTEAAPGMPAPPGCGSAPDGIEALWPGPDGFGYTGVTCTYSWVDISTTGAQVVLADDDFAGPFPIGFTFAFYDQSYTDFYVSSNGFVSFGAGSTALTNACPLPDAGTPDYISSLLWDDLDPFDTSDPIYYETFASCPVGAGQCLVVTYDDFCHYPGGATCDTAGTFQAIIFDDGIVRIQILDAGFEEGSGSTTGIEGGNAVSGHGLTYACNTAASLSDNLCVEMVQAPGINLAPDEIAGPGCPGVTRTTGMSLFNNSGAGATFALSYNIDTVNAAISGPASIVVADGATEAFDVDITPDANLTHGTPITGAIDATGGGYVDSSTINLTADTAVIQGWTPIADTPAGVRYHATTYHDGNVYQIGGETGWWIFTDAVHRYNIGTDTWDTPAPLPQAVYGMGAVTVGDNIYVIGGSQCTVDPNIGCTAGAFTDVVQIYDTAAGTWSVDATDPLMASLAFASVVTDGTYIYVMGGLDATGALHNSFYTYDPAAANGSRWWAGSPLATARAHAAAAYIDGFIYVAGGWLGGATLTDTVEVYDTTTGGTWAVGPPMPVAVSPFGAGSLGSHMITFGNFLDTSTGSSTYTCSQDTYGLDTTTGTWMALGQLPRCLYGTDGVNDGAFFYVNTGRTNENGWHMALENQVGENCMPFDPLEIFSDGFELGDTSAWTSTTP